ncbi:MAG: GNAT family N-acetyltransferase [Nonlabens sp.]
MQHDIKHKETDDRGIFYINIDNKKIAELTYSLDDNVMIIDHTEVHPSQEGKGIGTQITQHAVQFARDNDRKVNPLCPFAEVLFDQNEEWNDLRV